MDYDDYLLRLELSQQAPAPAGRVVGPDGTAETFDGWLELLAALHQLLPTALPLGGLDADLSGNPREATLLWARRQIGQMD